VVYADDGVLWTEKKDIDFQYYFNHFPMDKEILEGQDLLGRPMYKANLGSKDMGNYLASDKNFGETKKVFKYLGVYYSLHGTLKLA